MECRLCHNESEKDPCSPKCTDELASLRVEATWVNLALGEARESQYEIEATQYGPLYVRFDQLQALHRALTLGVQSMSSFHSTDTNEHFEVQEWRAQQSKDDKDALPYLQKKLRHLEKKINKLEKELSHAEHTWEEAASKVATIEDALRKIAEVTGDDSLPL
jgi:septal ring factor EnvC (AmiA/AmiB activator)